MRNLFALVLMLTTIAFSCTKDDVQDEKPTSITLTMSGNANSLKLGSEVTFEIKDNKANDVTSKAVIYVNKSTISGSKFTFSEAGSHEVYANYNGLKSNKLTVEVVKESTTVPSGQYSKKVLVHEFTGTWCGFCASALLDVKELHDKYPAEMVGVVVHMEGSGPENDGSFDYKRANEFNVDAQPTIWYNYDQDFTYLTPESVSNYTEPTTVGLAIDYNERSNKAVVRVALGNDTKDKKIVAFLVEDDLTADQLNYDNADPNSPAYNKGEVIKNFKYNDVARAELTASPLGDVIPEGEVKNGVYTVEYSLNGKKDNVVKMENTKVVAYLLGADGKAMNAQVAKANENKDFD